VKGPQGGAQDGRLQDHTAGGSIAWTPRLHNSVFIRVKLPHGRDRRGGLKEASAHRRGASDLGGHRRRGLFKTGSKVRVRPADPLGPTMTLEWRAQENTYQ
jgi:hypothetical protein